MERKPISSLALMQHAASCLFEQILPLITLEQKVIVLCGTGNNGGDGLCIAKLLRDHFFRVEVWYAKISQPTPENLACLQTVLSTEEIGFREIKAADKLPEVGLTDVFVDALMGYSFRPPWKDGWEKFITQINEFDNLVISIDLPSGLNDTDVLADVCIHATYTLSIESPNRCFFYRDNEHKVGIWKIVPIGLDPDFYREENTGYYSIDAILVQNYLQKRGFFDQKWNYGHAALVTGCSEMPGAALLSAKACCRGGAGLVTCFVPSNVASTIHLFIPEAMTQNTGTTSLDQTPFFSEKITALGIGPGLGRNSLTMHNILQTIQKYPNLPKVIDADALNALATKQDEMKNYVQNAILTPHEKEFERLFGKTNNQVNMENLALQKAGELQSIIILKGAYSRVCTPDGKIYYNTTGNPGMAKGGSGDVLTGLITAYLAQGYSLLAAAITGVYIHGLAGDLALKNFGVNGMLATDIIQYIGKAMMKTEEQNE